MHRSLEAFEKGLRANDETIAPSMIYAYAALQEGVPFANGAPNLTADIRALQELSREKDAPICGKDFKTGQTLIKTILAPGFKARMIGLNGWFSTNILGNRDGEVLDDPGSFKTKEESKLSVLEHILQPELYPELYGNICHKVRINYYPPRGDNKEGWDNIDIFGWLGYPMQIKVDFLCRDSILAAPIVLDLVLFLDLAKRSPELRGIGIQEWLSFYFKSPMTAPRALSRARPVHPVDEAEEHAAPPEGRRPDYAPGAGVLRLGVQVELEAKGGLRARPWYYCITAGKLRRGEPRRCSRGGRLCRSRSPRRRRWSRRSSHRRLALTHHKAQRCSNCRIDAEWSVRHSR